MLAPKSMCLTTRAWPLCVQQQQKSAHTTGRGRGMYKSSGNNTGGGKGRVHRRGKGWGRGYGTRRGRGTIGVALYTSTLKCRPYAGFFV